MRILAVIAVLIPALASAHSDDYMPTAQGAVDSRAMTAPERNTIYSCDGGSVVPVKRPWVGDDGRIDFDQKPAVSGNVLWNSVIKVNAGSVSGNGLPTHPTGEFPVKDESVARFDRNPNPIREQRLNFSLPRNPQAAAKPSCLGKGPIGIMLTGATVFNALDAENHDAVATELFDKCEGHPERNGMYHYHHYSPCFDSAGPGMPSPLLGYALDGFGIYGPRGDKGQLLTNADLDECHGIKSDVPDGKGGTKNVYHYVFNNEFPYSLGCYRGTPAALPHPGAGMQDDHRPPDLRMPAMKLGVTVDELRDALGQFPPDLDRAARALGVSVDDLRNALDVPDMGQATQSLGNHIDDLRDSLGMR